MAFGDMKMDGMGLKLPGLSMVPLGGATAGSVARALRGDEERRRTDLAIKEAAHAALIEQARSLDTDEAEKVWARFKASLLTKGKLVVEPEGLSPKEGFSLVKDRDAFKCTLRIGALIAPGSPRRAGKDSEISTLNEAKNYELILPAKNRTQVKDIFKALSRALHIEEEVFEGAKVLFSAKKLKTDDELYFLTGNPGQILRLELNSRGKDLESSH